MVFRLPCACSVSRDTDRGRESLSTMPLRKLRYLPPARASAATDGLGPRAVLHRVLPWRQHGLLHSWEDPGEAANQEFPGTMRLDSL